MRICYYAILVDIPDVIKVLQDKLADKPEILFDTKALSFLVSLFTKLNETQQFNKTQKINARKKTYQFLFNNH